MKGDGPEADGLRWVVRQVRRVVATMQVVHHGCKARGRLRQDLGGPDVDDGRKRGGLGPQLGASEPELLRSEPSLVAELVRFLRRTQEFIHGPKPMREGDEET